MCLDRSVCCSCWGAESSHRSHFYDFLFYEQFQCANSDQCSFLKNVIFVLLIQQSRKITQITLQRLLVFMNLFSMCFECIFLTKIPLANIKLVFLEIFMNTLWCFLKSECLKQNPYPIHIRGASSLHEPIPCAFLVYFSYQSSFDKYYIGVV